MEWKKVAESKELIILEKDLGDHKIKIEARKTGDLSWEVFKTKVSGESSRLISEFTLDTKNQVKKLIEKLKKDETKLKRLSSGSSIHTKRDARQVTLKRVFKEDYVEKWYFFIGPDKERNFLVAKFASNIDVDVVMHEKYRYYEKTILMQIEEKLGLKELGETINYQIYYFRKFNSAKNLTSRNSEYNLNFIDIEFGFPDGEDEFPE